MGDGDSISWAKTKSQVQPPQPRTALVVRVECNGEPPALLHRWEVRLPHPSSGATTHWDGLRCYAGGWTGRGVWLNARSHTLRFAVASPPMRCICSVRSQPIPSGSTPSAAPWRSPSPGHAAARRPLSLRSGEALPAHGQARASRQVPHHGNGDVPRDGYAVLAEQAETAMKNSGESRETYRACCLLFASCSIATTRSWSSPFGTSLRKLSHAFTAPA